MRNFRLASAGLALLLAGLMPTAQATSPLVAPGDYQFRNDLRILQDAGVLQGPFSIWPVSLSQVYDGLASLEEEQRAALSPSQRSALGRVQRRLSVQRAEGWSAQLGVRGGSEPQLLRNFEDTPRGEQEATLGASWTGGSFAGELKLTQVRDDPAEDQDFRLDGTWVGAVKGNWMFAAGLIDRYWGPGWQSGLIISNNARPRPGLTIRRMRSTPFATPWLSWLGPWQFTFFLEQLESDRPVDKPFFTGARFAFLPFESLEIGLSRSAQFGGGDSDVGLDTIANVVSGQSTDTNPLVGSASGINQLAGLDGRWNLPYLPMAIYGEFIGEDEQGIGPAEFLSQGGVELWGGFGDSGHAWRLIVEYADTSAGLLEEGEGNSDNFGVAYNNNSFPVGYRFRNRVLGHSAESDALLTSGRLLVSFSNGTFVNLAAMSGELNRTAINNARGRGAANTLTLFNEDVEQAELSVEHLFRFGRIKAAVGQTRRTPRGGDEDSETFGWVGFDRHF